MLLFAFLAIIPLQDIQQKCTVLNSFLYVSFISNVFPFTAVSKVH